MKIGDKLKNARLKKSMTQEEVAEKLLFLGSQFQTGKITKHILTLEM